MAFTDDQLYKIFERTDGKCHICTKKLCRSNYGVNKGRGKWEVEHAIPKSKGGTDHLNNLYAACISCNRSKGNGTTKAARAVNGRTKAPLSKQRKNTAQTENAVLGGLAGLVAGALVGLSTGGIALACVAGGTIGGSIDPDD